MADKTYVLSEMAQRFLAILQEQVKNDAPINPELARALITLMRESE